jgi:hypothetical protein
MASRIALALVLIPLAGCAPKQAAEPPAAACDRACLYGVLDEYLAALKAHDAGAVKWTANAMFTENNVVLEPGDGLWNTISGLDAYEMRFADMKAGQVGIFGVVAETTTRRMRCA